MLLSELEVVAIDCQTTNATPELGDLLELGWAICGRDGTVRAPYSSWIVPRSEREISRAVRRLTGFDEACLATAIAPEDAWRKLRGDIAELARIDERTPAVIHFARFELTFLRDLQARVEGEQPFPIEAVCLHRIAQRLYPNLPRRGLRALAGYLGHSAELVRRCAGHVEATAFIWRTLVPALAEVGVRSFADLTTWLDETSPPKSSRGQKRTFPMPSERRRALPDRPGVYRFLRSNGDVLYVGKALSVKKRIASHFSAGARANERTLEMLTQAADVAVIPTATVLEAALLEADEIKRLDPPYNVHLRERDRRAWFASSDLRTAASAPDDVHRIGPLPSEHALSEIAAVRVLAEGKAPTTELLARAMGVPLGFAPPADLFAEAWRPFAEEHLGRGSPWIALQRAAKKIKLPAREEEQDGPPSGWDRDRVRRWLDRSVVRGVQLVRRARWLCVLSDAVVAFREPNDSMFRLLSCDGAVLAPASDFTRGSTLPAPQTMRRRAHERRATFDAARYDRLRVLATELKRVHDEGGEVVIRVGDRVIERERLVRLL